MDFTELPTHLEPFMTVFDQKSGKINKIEQISRLGRFPPISIEFANLANFWSDMLQKHVRVGKK